MQHDHGYLALGLELIVGVGGPKFERLFPKSEAFLARGCPGPRVYLLGPDLYFDVGVRENIAIPPWVLGRASLRGDYEVTAAVRSVKQREYELIARLAASGGQQQCRRRDLTSPGHGYLVHVPVGSAASKIAVRVLDHPVRQVRSEFRLSHRDLLQSCTEHTIGRRIGQFRLQEQARIGA